jgi:heme A synthase
MSRPDDKGVRINSRSRFTTLALTSLVSTIILVLAGSFVRVTGYGLGCPDWPLCYGRAVPPIEIGAWVEFGHRLLGGVVSIQIAALTWLAYKNYRDERWLWRPAVATAVLLIIQIALGGLHVLNELPRWTGLVHTGVATAIVGLLALIVAVSQSKLLALSERVDQYFDLKRMRIWTLIGASSAYILILSGSLVTRTGSSLACPSFPLCGIVNVPDSLRQYVEIQMGHRIIALIVLIVVSYLLYLILKNGKGETILKNLSYLLVVLLLVQVGLGISNVLLGLPLWSRILHLGTATTIWAVLVILAVLFQQPQVETMSIAASDTDVLSSQVSS